MKVFKTIAAIYIAVFFLGSVLLYGCSKPAERISESTTPVISSNQGTVQETTAETPEKIDYAGMNVNEDGKIMVLMYHGIGDKEEEWVRTADNLRKDLQTLYDKGYRTISLHDYINNNIKTPAGFIPVVITFDDSLQNQFRYIEKDGQTIVDPNCAVGIMQDFEKSHEDFGNAATFYIYYPVPFGQKDKISEKLEYLLNSGFDIGNHSYTHEMLGSMDADGIQKQLGLNVKLTNGYIPGYTVDTLALPYGSRPKDEALRKYIISGEYEGTKYTNNAVLLVGANPAPAPCDKNFDPAAIPRVRASEMNVSGTGIYDWLKYFDSHPAEKYISDGNPSTVVIPENRKDKINSEKLGDKKLIIY